MKVLYVAGRWDPRVQDEYSGNDYGAYNAIAKQPGVDLSLVGPLAFPSNSIERALTKVYRIISGKRLIKYSLTYPRKSSLVINEALLQIQPDVVFSKYSAPLAQVELEGPFVYMCDSIIPFSKDLANEFSKPAYRIMEKWERNVIQKATRVITYSQACANLIISEYDTPAEKVIVMPIPAFVPQQLQISETTDNVELKAPLRLLFIGKRERLRGVDIAIQTVKKLNEEGIAAELRIVGLSGSSDGMVRYMGVYNKEDTQALKNYFGNFLWAHLLLHPSRFHAAGIVISEAAAFGIPTITNSVGGLATTVLHEKTGLVLPANSPASEYCKAIKSLMHEPDRYLYFRRNARQRFTEELDWQVAGQKLFEIVRQAALTNSKQVLN